MKVGQYWGNQGLIIKILKVYNKGPRTVCDWEIIKDLTTRKVHTIGRKHKAFSIRNIKNHLKYMPYYNSPLWRAINDTTS